MIMFSEMNGYQFEEFVANLFRKMGFSVDVTTYTNDGGIDLIATYSQPIFSGKYIIQCKNWATPVGQPEVRDLYGVVMDQRANKGILITPSDYTQQAYDFAEGKNIELINGTILDKIISISQTDICFGSSVNELSITHGDRYRHYEKIINDEPTNASNYINLINYLRNPINTQDEEICTIELFDTIIQWTKRLIDRCYKSPSKEDEKTMALLLQVEALICSGRLAEATEILIRRNKFWIKDFCITNGQCWPGGGMSYHSLYAWNLYAAFSYINYQNGCHAIISGIDNGVGELLEYYTQKLFGHQFVYPTPVLKPHGRSNARRLDTTIFFSNQFINPAFFYERFYTKTPAEYAEEIDAVLTNHGIL